MRGRSRGSRESAHLHWGEAVAAGFGEDSEQRPVDRASGRSKMAAIRRAGRFGE
jgi:hypothetical protein